MVKLIALVMTVALAFTIANEVVKPIVKSVGKVSTTLSIKKN